MAPSIEERVARLEAQKAIEELIASLARAFDNGPSADQLLPLFTPDAEFLLDRYGSLTTADGIAKGVAGNAAQGFRWTIHYLVSPKIVVSAGLASAVVDFMLWEVATAASGRAYWIGGRYVAHCRFDGEAWRFHRLELQADLMSHYPDGWREKPGAISEA